MNMYSRVSYISGGSFVKNTCDILDPSKLGSPSTKSQTLGTISIEMKAWKTSIFCVVTYGNRFLAVS